MKRKRFVTGYGIDTIKGHAVDEEEVKEEVKVENEAEQDDHKARTSRNRAVPVVPRVAQSK